ncbi:MAG: glycosyltransferase family 2 protein [Nocardioidaceae bacterium]|nr:MAG: glycosyltransferase family 2 protein [Nocardioidaceae bacterium]
MSPRRSMLRVRNLADRLIGRAEPETEDRSERPTVSVIVPYYNVEAYLAECLDSVCNQTYTDFEVLLVDDGSPDGSREVAERYCATDERLRLLTRPNGGLGAARNTGIRHAKGKYLTFVDSDDRLPPRALVTLVESAERTGSDIVVGSVMRFDSRREWMPGWTDVVHRQERPAVAVVDHPEILRNLYTWNKLFRRDFWDRQELWFREGVAYEDQPIITQLYARADRIDILPEAVYEYRARDDRSSISQQTATLPDLRDRIQAWELSREALKGVVDDRIWYGWLQTLFDTHFHWYLTSPGTADEEYWRLFTTAVRSLAADAPPEIWAATAPDKRVRIALALAGRKQDAQEFVRQHPADRRLWPAEVDDRGVTLQLLSGEIPGWIRNCSGCCPPSSSSPTRSSDSLAGRCRRAGAGDLRMGLPHQDRSQGSRTRRPGRPRRRYGR